MNAKLLSILVAAVLVTGCKTTVVEVDRTPPFAPRGIYTETGDGFILISWLRNQEPDVAGYKVYSSDAFDGVYTAVGQTTGLTISDFGATNGITAYYAVTAFDDAGNESGLSTDVAYDTPRPEGFGVVLPNFHFNPTGAGYDFSTYSVGPFDDQFTDIFFEFLSGTYFMNVWDDTEIQDVGYTESLADIRYAPTGGWSPTRDVRLILDHTYVVRTWDSHYAKVRIRSLSDTRVIFDWAYQLQPDNTRLKQTVDRGPLRTGAGFASRTR
ncbi:MAG TPA: hypothetical protein VI932_01485 [Bacteroidota bacterium]|nr:hypothetical protein [Bacteroidota bacterium]